MVTTFSFNTCRATIGDRMFGVAAACVWNGLSAPSRFLLKIQDKKQEKNLENTGHLKTYVATVPNEQSLQSEQLHAYLQMNELSIHGEEDYPVLIKTIIYNYYYHFTALWILSWTTRVSWYQKGKTKTNLDFLEQETVSGSGISWSICKSAPRPSQITSI